jgi:hypothetical protein
MPHQRSGRAGCPPPAGPWRGGVSTVRLPTCGVSTTCSNARSSAGTLGSASNTSSAAMPSVRARSAAISASWSTSEPRATLTSVPSGTERRQHLRVDHVPRGRAARRAHHQSSRCPAPARAAMRCVRGRRHPPSRVAGSSAFACRTPRRAPPPPGRCGRNHRCRTPCLATRGLAPAACPPPRRRRAHSAPAPAAGAPPPAASVSARSATSSVSTPGVLVTRMPRARVACQVDRVDADAVDRDDLQPWATGPAAPRRCRWRRWSARRARRRPHRPATPPARRTAAATGGGTRKALPAAPSRRPTDWPPALELLVSCCIHSGLPVAIVQGGPVSRCHG